MNQTKTVVRFKVAKSYSIKAGEIDKKWILVDAAGQIMGRLSTWIASRLRGKDKPTYTPHMDGGDNIIVINTSKIIFTGNKKENTLIYKHTGYVGNMKTIALKDRFQKDSGLVLRESVRRMLLKSTLGKQLLSNLKTFPGPEHTHLAQQPILVDTLIKKGSTSAA